jgi:acyl-CoA thioesterase-2
VPEWNELGFASLFAIQAVGTDTWSVPNPSVERATVYGGQVAAQAILAASRTIDSDRAMHSLHAYFLRSGKPGEPMTISVERTRDGRSFGTRRVVATQDGGGIVFSAALSFHRDEPSPVLLRSMPDVPAPEECKKVTGGQSSEMAVELRVVPATSADSPLGALGVWVRSAEPLPDDRVVHTAALAFMSDLRTGTAIGKGLGGLGGFAMVASLDHALWVHEAPRADSWLLMTVETLAYAHARGIILGSFHALNGAPVATFTQELVIRPVGEVRPTN